MILWNDIAAHKFASLFLRPITDDQAPGYHSIVYRWEQVYPSGK